MEKVTPLLPLREPSSFHYLGTALIVTFAVWLLQFHWNRRHLYRLASTMPGPTPWPLIGSSHKFMGDASFIYNSVMDIFATYKDYFRCWFGPTLVCGVSKPEYIEIVLNSPKSLDKMYLYKYAETLVGRGLFTASVPVWKRHRKIIGPTFNQKILDTFVPVFVEQGAILVDKLETMVDQGEFDIFHHVATCTLDIICETAMGVKVNAQTTASEFNRWVDRLLEIAFLRMFVLGYHFDFIFKLTQLSRDQDTLIEKFYTFIQKVVRDKRREFEEKKAHPAPPPSSPTNKRKAFLELLIEISDSPGGESKLTDEELRDEVNTFMIAGSDTTASSSSFLFCLLGMHPHIQQKIYEEILDVIGERELQAEDLPQLEYTERVVKESLRLFPVGAFIVRDVYEDLRIDKNVVLPGGCSVIIGIMPVHRNAKYWEEPLTFNPDRFLPECEAKRHNYTYLPFSRGPRNCIGVKYGMMAMKAMVVVLCKKYKFATSYKRVEDIKLKTNLVVRPVDGFKVSLSLRN